MASRLSGPDLPPPTSKARTLPIEQSPATELDIDVHTAPASGALTFDGAAFHTGCRWNRHSFDVASASFALDAGGAYAGRVPPGTYDLLFLGGGRSQGRRIRSHLASTGRYSARVLPGTYDL